MSEVKSESEQSRTAKRRAARLKKIRQSVERLEDTIFADHVDRRPAAFRGLYYLERLAKKAN